MAGYQSFVNLVGSSGVEESYNKVLTGQDDSLQLKNLGNALQGKADTNDVVLSLSESAQQTAQQALGGQRGSVVALDVHTGAVLAMYSNPTFDPNALSVHSTAIVQAAFNLLHQQRRHRQRCAAACVPRALPTGLDVQGRHHEVGPRDRPPTPDTQFAFRGPTASRSPA